MTSPSPPKVPSRSPDTARTIVNPSRPNTIEINTALDNTVFRCFDIPASSNTAPNGETITTLVPIVAAMSAGVKINNGSSDPAYGSLNGYAKDDPLLVKKVTVTSFSFVWLVLLGKSSNTIR